MTAIKGNESSPIFESFCSKDKKKNLEGRIDTNEGHVIK